jgi:hypothetical protein
VLIQVCNGKWKKIIAHGTSTIQFVASISPTTSIGHASAMFGQSAAHHFERQIQSQNTPAVAAARSFTRLPPPTILCMLTLSTLNPFNHLLLLVGRICI